MPLPGVGLLLGLALVATLLGTLLVAACRLSGESAPVAVAGPARAALWLGVTLAAAGIALAALRVVRLPPRRRWESWHSGSLGDSSRWRCFRQCPKACRSHLRP